MAASTIGRSTLTDGSGGTVLNNALWQSSIYDKVDALVAAAITFGSTVSAEGFGTHSFSAGGTGGNILRIRNTTSGTTNYAILQLGNNSIVNTGEIFATSTTYTPSSDALADAVGIRCNGAGGVSIAAVNASGQVRIYTGAPPVERVRFTSTALLIAPSGTFPTVSSSDMLVLASATPEIGWYESDQGADGKWWIQAVSAGSWSLQTQNDARSGAANAIVIARSGNTVTSLTFGAQTLQIDGSSSTPAYSFTGDATSGMFRNNGNTHVGIAVQGRLALDVSKEFAGGGQWVFLPDVAGGTGSKSGTVLQIGRNSSGSGAAGCLSITRRDGTQDYIWSDAGTLRINSGTFPTENDGTPHTGGTVVGTQTSSRDSKDVIAVFTDTAMALDLVRRIPLYRWRYKLASASIRQEEFVGIITDDTPEFGMDRDETHPGGKSLNVPSAIGYLVASIQEQQRQIDRLVGQRAA